LGEALTVNHADLLNSHVRVISDVLRSVHEDFAEFEEWQEMVIAAAFYRDTRTPIASFLYGTVGSALEPHAEYVCKGGGKTLAQYFCHRLYAPWPDRRYAMALAAFVFRETEDHIEGVGRGTDMMYLATQQRLILKLSHGVVKELEDAIPSLRDTVEGCWRNNLKMPRWLETELYKGENEISGRKL
jgi:hypothetical protein